MSLADSYGQQNSPEKEVSAESYADQFSAQCVGHDHDEAIIHAAAAAMYLHNKNLTVKDEYMESVHTVKPEKENKEVEHMAEPVHEEFMPSDAESTLSFQPDDER